MLVIELALTINRLIQALLLGICLPSRLAVLPFSPSSPNFSAHLSISEPFQWGIFISSAVGNIVKREQEEQEEEQQEELLLGLSSAAAVIKCVLACQFNQLLALQLQLSANLRQNVQSHFPCSYASALLCPAPSASAAPATELQSSFHLLWHK